MHLYLAQHGIPKPKTEDPTRPLSAVGREEVARVGAWAASVGCQVGQIWHSGKKRAQETADILASHLEPSGGVVMVKGLSPLDDVEPLAARLREAGDSIMVVGHLPFLGRLAGYLVNDDPARTSLRFRMGGIVCLGDQDGWLIEWAVTPELVA